MTPCRKSWLPRELSLEMEWVLGGRVFCFVLLFLKSCQSFLQDDCFYLFMPEAEPTGALLAFNVVIAIAP